MFIGIDDTDSTEGMCTTYLAPILYEELKECGGIPVELPYLVRLNPNIPYKTRGNAAICLKVSLSLENGRKERVEERVMRCVESLAVFSDPKTNPGIVFVDEPDKDAVEDLRNFSKAALHRIVEIDEARNLIKEHNFDAREYKNGRGIIGALSAIGIALDLKKKDHTYELIAYRKKENLGKKRRIDEGSVFYADRITYPKTWDTVDLTNGRIVLSPSGKDPVLYGIRGDNIDEIFKASNLIESEPIGEKTLFMTNQGTDGHLKRVSIKEMEEYGSYIAKGIVSKVPVVMEGGHLFFEISDDSKSVRCAAFEPTKQFRNIIRKLKIGDEVEVYGGFKKDTMNLEKINIKKLNDLVSRNPRCPICGKRMKSAGKDQGFRCKRCKTEIKEREIDKVDRVIEEGLYEVPPCARRHISKPLIRMNEERRHPSR